MNEEGAANCLALSAGSRTASGMFVRSVNERPGRQRRLTLGVMLASRLPSHAAPNYFMRTWQVENGLPQNKVTSVVQTHDGYLCLSTYNGLARFDGVNFTVFD